MTEQFFRLREDLHGFVVILRHHRRQYIVAYGEKAIRELLYEIPSVLQGRIMSPYRLISLLPSFVNNMIITPLFFIHATRLAVMREYRGVRNAMQTSPRLMLAISSGYPC